MKYPAIIKFRQKHFDSLYIVDNQEEQQRVFLGTLIQRYNDKYYDWMEKYETMKLNKIYLQIKEIVEAKDLKRAQSMMSYLSSGEYEGFEIIDPQEIPKI